MSVDPDAHARYRTPLTKFQIDNKFCTEQDKKRRGAISAGHRRGMAKLKSDLVSIERQRDEYKGQRDRAVSLLEKYLSGVDDVEDLLAEIKRSAL